MFDTSPYTDLLSINKPYSVRCQCIYYTQTHKYRRTPHPHNMWIVAYDSAVYMRIALLCFDEEYIVNCNLPEKVNINYTTHG